METCVCVMCGLEKELNLFYNRSKHAEVKRKECKECSKLMNKKQRQNSIKYKDRTPEYKKKISESNCKTNKNSATRNKKIVNLLKDKPCKDCGNKFPPYCMDFDHLPQYKKYKHVSTLVNRGFILEKILEEIEKCELVCANCHRIRTFSRKQQASQAVDR